MRKRIVSFLLAVVLMLSLFGFPLMVSAAEPVVTDFRVESTGAYFTVEFPPEIVEVENVVTISVIYGGASVATISDFMPADGIFTGTFPGLIPLGASLSVFPGDILVTTAPVTFEAGAGGSISAAVGTRTITSGTFVPVGSEVTFTAVPSAGNVVASWSVGGTVVPGATGLTFSHAVLAGGLDVSVAFTADAVDAPVTFGVVAGSGTLTAVNNATGAVVNSGDEVPVGTVIAFTASPSAGQRIRSWYENSVLVSGTGTNRQFAVGATGLHVGVAFETIPPVVVGRFPPVVGVERETGPGHTRPGQRTFPEVEGPDDVAAPDGWLCLCFRRPPFSNRVASEWFDDVALGQWYHGHVSVALSNDAFRGVAPRVFAPQTTMSRAMFAQVLFNLVSCCNDIGLYWNQPSPFTDVTQDDWFFPVINWAYANGLISGVGGGRFAPNDPVTREQMAALLNRFADAENITFPSGATPAFTDQATISSWAVADVQAIQGAGIVGGFPDGSFRPQGNATRAEVATIFAGFLNMVQAQYAGQ